MTSEEKPAEDPAAGDEVLEDPTIWITAHEIAAARGPWAQVEPERWGHRAESDATGAERDRLLGQIREVNEKLVVAIVEAQQRADEANAARVAADHNEERFRSLVQTSSAVVWQANRDGRVLVDPDAWRKFTGVVPGPGAWSWLEAVHPDDRDRVRETWADAVTTANPYTCQHRIRSCDGGYAWVVGHAVPVPRTGAVREWIGMMTDISDRVRVEQAREQFIAILGHDLRNPLAAILMGAEILGELPEPHRSVVARLVRSGHRIEAMIRDLLDFARGRLGGGIPVVPQPCDLLTVCNEVVEEMKQAHPERAIGFEAVGDLRGDWDPDRVEQLISNLVGNAVAHGTGPVRVTARDEGDDVVTTVHNQGPAIPSALLPILFEPFTRPASAADGGPSKGLGLGLYIASEIVHAHGGTLSVVSRDDEGTTFTIRWPRRMPQRRPRPTSQGGPTGAW